MLTSRVNPPLEATQNETGSFRSVKAQQDQRLFINERASLLQRQLNSHRMWLAVEVDSGKVQDF